LRLDSCAKFFQRALRNQASLVNDGQMAAQSLDDFENVKIVAPRAIMRWSMALSVPDAIASTPSKGSSRKRILGP
jgi:hypothetical protein